MSTVQDNTKLINAITRFMTYVIANRSLKLENDRLVAMDSLKGFDTKKTLDSLFLTTVDKYTVIARTENKFNISSIKEEDILKAVTCEDLIKLATDPLRSQKEDKAKPKATPTASLQNKVLKSVTEQLEEPVTEKEKTMEEELREETPEEVEEMPEEAVEETPEEVEEIPEETVNEDDEVPEETVEEIPEETVEDEAEDTIPVNEATIEELPPSVGLSSILRLALEEWKKEREIQLDKPVVSQTEDFKEPPKPFYTSKQPVEEVEEMPEEAVEETPEEVEEIPEETVNEDDEVPEETVEEIPEETVEDEAEDGIPEIRLLDHCCSTCKDREECIAKSNKEGLK